MSGFRISNLQIQNTPKNDFFPNIEYIQKVNVPIFIIHGDKDS